MNKSNHNRTQGKYSSTLIVVNYRSHCPVSAFPAKNTILVSYSFQGWAL